MAKFDNNMGDFFRKKLQEGAGEEHWDRPDGVIEQSVLATISTKPALFKLRSYWPAAALILLFCSWGYAACLGIKLNNKQQELATQQGQLSEQKLEIQQLQKQFENSKTCQEHQLQTQKTIGALQKELTITATALEKSQQQQLVRQQQEQAANHKIKDLQAALNLSNIALDDAKKEITLWESQHQQLPLETENQNKLVENKPTLSKENNKPTTTEIIPEPNYQALASISTTILLSEKILDKQIELSPEPILKLKRKAPGLEIGWHSGWTQMNINSFRESENTELVSYTRNNSLAHGHKHGLKLGIALDKNKKWWIETGLEYSALFLEQDTDLSLLYDESTEYNLASGELVNDLDIQFYTPYSAWDYELQLKLPQNNQIDDNDILLMETTENIDFQRFQIPLGIAWQFGERRFNWRWHGGAAWNMMRTEKYELQFELEAGAEELDLEVDMENINSNFSQYLSFYTGFSGQYQLSKHWQASFGYQAAYNLNAPLLEEPAHSFNHNLQVGIHYQF